MSNAHLLMEQVPGNLTRNFGPPPIKKNMVKTQRRYVNNEQVLEDFHMQSPRINFDENHIILNEETCPQIEERKQFLKSEIKAQGGVLSNLIGKVEVEMNHHVPMAEAWMDGITNYFSCDSKSFSLSNLARTYYSQWYLSALLFLFFGYMVGGHSSRVAALAFFICLGIGNLFSWMYCMAYVGSGHESFIALLAEMRNVYDNCSYTPKEDEEPIFEPTDSTIIAQSGIEPDTMASLLLAILSFGLGFKPKSGGINTIKEFLRTTPTMKDNMLGIVSSSYTLLNELSIKLKCEKYLSTILEIPIVDDVVEKWNDKVNSFINTISNNTDGSHEENMTLYNMFVKESKEIEKTLSKGSISYITLIDTVKSLEKCKNNANKRFTSLKGFRPEPVMTFFRGAPGVVKSILSSRLATMLNNVTLPEHLLEDFYQRPDNYVFRKSTDKWWDGYTEKANVTIIDDIFQIVEGLVDPTTSDSAMVIRMTNAEEFAVPIAEASGKNSTYFRSNFIVASSNTFNEQLLSSIHSKEAVRRRLHFFVDVKVSDKYTKNGITDWANLPHIKDETGTIIPDATTFPEDFWKLEYSEMIGTNETSKREISFAELFEKIVERHYKHLMQFEINKTAAQEEMHNMRESTLRRLDSAKNKYAKLRESLQNKFKVNKISKIPMPGVYPQSGLPSFEDQSDGSQSDVIDEECSKVETLISYYLDLSNDYRALLTHTFHRALYVYDINSIWGKQPLLSFLRSLDDYEVYHYMKIFDNDTASAIEMNEGFSLQLNVTFENRIKENKTPHLGETLPFTSRLKNIGHSFTESLSTSLVFINKYKIPIVVGAIASASIIYTIHKLIKTLNGKTSAQSGNTDRYIGKGPSRGKNVKPTKKSTKGTINIPLSQSGVEFKTLLNGSSFKLDYKSAQRDVLTAAIDKYHFIMYVHEHVKDQLRSRRLGHCINVMGNIYAMPFHFMFNLEDFLEGTNDKESYVTITTASNARKFSVTVRELLNSCTFTEESVATDVCIFRAGHEELSKGALKYFVTDNQDNWRKRSVFPITIIGTQQSGEKKEHTSYRIVETKTSLIKDGIVIKPTWKTENGCDKYRLINTLKYEGDFSAGDCGSLIFLKQNDLGCSVIAGFHLAGETSKGYGNIITQSLLQELLDLEDPITYFDEEIEPQGLARLSTVKLDYHIPELSLRGTFDKSSSVATCSKSDIMKSLLHGKIPGEVGKVRERPAMLFAKVINGIKIDPKQIALQNYARFPPAIDNNVLNEAVQSYYSLIVKHDNILTSYKNVIDTKLALHSFGDHVHSIASSTSAGWPMNTCIEDDLKKMYYKSLIQNDIKLNELAFSQIDVKIKDIEEMYRNDIRPVFIYSDALKDETRPIDKVLEGKTRMFSGCPFTLLIMFRKYFGAFIDFYFDKNLDLGSAIGINPYSSDWHDLAMNLTRFSSDGKDLCVGAGDFSKFDCSETPEILQGIYTIICSWYGDHGEDSKIRFMLWKEITHSRHIFGNEYYEWSNGMPSGNPMTAIINTMYNHLAFRMSFHYAGCEINEFNKNVYLCALGDDNVFCVSDEFKEDFNELTLVSCMARIGLKYTTELKGEATVPFRTIEDVEFLKRSFRPIRLKGQFRYLAPIQFTTIVNMLYWTKKGHMSDQISCDNISLALREISLHGKEVFDEYYPLLRSLKEQYYPDVVSKHSSYTDYKSTLYAVLAMEHRL